jgi:uncharacterized Zn-binding protein involved in type VI secretion
MALPAARENDSHVCSQSTPRPHGGGPVTDGFVKVLIQGLSGARIGDPTKCVMAVEVGPDFIKCGSKTVLFGGRPAARLSSATLHGGAIVSGSPTVLVGGPDACLSASEVARLTALAKVLGKIAENNERIKELLRLLAAIDQPDTPEEKFVKDLNKALEPKQTEVAIPAGVDEWADQIAKNGARNQMNREIAERRAQNGSFQKQADGLQR